MLHLNQNEDNEASCKYIYKERFHNSFYFKKDILQKKGWA